MGKCDTGQAESRAFCDTQLGSQDSSSHVAAEHLESCSLTHVVHSGSRLRRGAVERKALAPFNFAHENLPMLCILANVHEDSITLECLIGIAAVNDGYGFLQYRPTEVYKKCVSTRSEWTRAIKGFLRTLRVLEKKRRLKVLIDDEALDHCSLDSETQALVIVDDPKHTNALVKLTKKGLMVPECEHGGMAAHNGWHAAARSSVSGRVGSTSGDRRGAAPRVCRPWADKMDTQARSPLLPVPIKRSFSSTASTCVPQQESESQEPSMSMCSTCEGSDDGGPSPVSVRSSTAFSLSLIKAFDLTDRSLVSRARTSLKCWVS
ncbi:hypothetical protein CRENBAI_017368 [Crenichthys baileyi]|uniref:Uncharacterized protein n=1 Tax=Crenichthys baileyi TaxID=28760 RepID=A0AAV9S4I7_9TELE